jgi:hypothetical protein
MLDKKHETITYTKKKEEAQACYDRIEARDKQHLGHPAS